jgi:hypothetical protein
MDQSIMFRLAGVNLNNPIVEKYLQKNKLLKAIPQAGLQNL